MNGRQQVTAAQSQAKRSAAGVDPLIMQAVADVDRSLLHWSLQQSPRQRLVACSRAAAALVRLRSAASRER
ncbi:MAG TPA: hypothetical protein VGS57_11245 [Thermoanaerobaculia bacterium]|nr:hypothetical protein [Thermoanaerobaculia bacterium]